MCLFLRNKGIKKKAPQPLCWINFVFLKQVA